MEIVFHKFHGSGNDFILIDERAGNILTAHPEVNAVVRQLCNRRLGIGADGLMLLRANDAYHFEMTYFNSDGNESSMCGNGGRCISAFAHMLKSGKTNMHFLAADGAHRSLILSAGGPSYIVSLQMKNLPEKDISEIELPPFRQKIYALDTGSPHIVIFDKDVNKIDVCREGRAIRYADTFKEQGTNVNFVQQTGTSELFVRTYERGVEAETLSCGTGATAAAIAAYMANIRHPEHTYNIQTKGGKLQVRFNPPDAKSKAFKDIWLTGPAVHVFKGSTII